MERLDATLPTGAYRAHPTVKLFVAVYKLIYEIIPRDPNARRFLMRGDLAKFRRAREDALPDRYRLMWVFSSREKVIFMLYLNDEKTLRKAGAASDPYHVFGRLVRQGKIGPDYAENRGQWLAANQKKDLPDS